MFEKSLQICLPVYSSTNLCSSVTLSFITSTSSTHQPVYLSTYITLSFIKSTLSTRPLTCVLLLPCLLLQATRSLVHLVHSSTNLVFYYKQLVHSSNLSTSLHTSNSFTCPPCSLVYLYYYIYLPCNRFFCVVPLHRHQE